MCLSLFDCGGLICWYKSWLIGACFSPFWLTFFYRSSLSCGLLSASNTRKSRWGWWRFFYLLLALLALFLNIKLHQAGSHLSHGYFSQSILLFLFCSNWLWRWLYLLFLYLLRFRLLFYIATPVTLLLFFFWGRTIPIFLLLFLFFRTIFIIFPIRSRTLWTLVIFFLLFLLLFILFLFFLVLARGTSTSTHSLINTTKYYSKDIKQHIL